MQIPKKVAGRFSAGLKRFKPVIAIKSISMRQSSAFVLSCVALTPLLTIKPLAAADLWRLPALIEPTSSGLEVRDSYCDELEKGDIITKVDGARVTKENAAGASKRLSKNRRTLVLEVLKNNKTRTESVTTIPQATLATKIEKRAEEKRQQEEAAAKEEMETWLSSTKFLDSRGKTWEIKEIEEANKRVGVSIFRAEAKHGDRERDKEATTFKDTSLGNQISIGHRVILTLRDILATPPGKTYSPDGRWSYESVADFMQQRGIEGHISAVETFFDFTDGEELLIPCRDGTVKTATEVWDEAVAKLISR